MPNILLEFTHGIGQCQDSVSYGSKTEREVPVDNLLQSLKPNQRKGSKPRCHLLTHGTLEQIAERLSKLIAPWGFVSATDKWMPQGFDDVTEAQLHNAPRLLDKDTYGQTLKSWWLAIASSTSVTPNWDIASTCTIDDKPGLLLVEAKAHFEELKQDDRCGANNKRNIEQIGQAIRKANDGLNKLQDGWHLTLNDHYQLCNRFAWSWKLATLGIPVVLVYLGFLNADEMENSFSDSQAWGNEIRSYARGIVPVSVWDRKLLLGDTPICPIIRSIKIRLNSTDNAINKADTKGIMEMNQR